MYTSSYTLASLNIRTFSPEAEDRYIISDGEGTILCSGMTPVTSPDILDLFSPPVIIVQSRILVGSTASRTWWVTRVIPGTVTPAGYTWNHLRTLAPTLPSDMLGICSRAVQLARFDEITTFCGRCGALNLMKEDEIAKLCPECGLLTFPRLSPAVIVRITDGNRILLARSPHFVSGMYSVLAGFVEPGESLEEGVCREVYEEVGLMIDQLQYFGSQPWPYPDSLMIGFTARYVSGEIVCDPAEIEDAGWYTGDNLPSLPGSQSISRALIDDFITRHS